MPKAEADIVWTDNLKLRGNSAEFGRLECNFQFRRNDVTIKIEYRTGRAGGGICTV